MSRTNMKFDEPINRSTNAQDALKHRATAEWYAFCERIDLWTNQEDMKIAKRERRRINVNRRK